MGMTDIFESWKKNRFIIVDHELVDNESLVILTDVQFWADHTDELINWCSIRNATTQGMTVVFGDEPTLTEFVLRWS